MYPPITETPLVPPSEVHFEEDCPVGWSVNAPSAIVYDAGKDTRCAKQFLDAHLPKRLIFYKNNFYELSIFGYYNYRSEESLKKAIRESDQASLLSSAKVSATVAAISELCETDTEPGKFLFPRTSDPETAHLMLFGNGYYDPTNDRFHPYDGRLFAIDPPAFAYDPDAQCPTWDRFLSSAIGVDDRDILHEFAGLAMTRNQAFHNMLVILGATRAGKSTTANVLEKLVGSSNTGHRIFRDIPQRSSFSGLEGKSLLIISDAHNIDDRHKEAALNVIKAVTGGDEISYHVLYKGTTSAKFGLRVVMVANFHPAFVDPSGALLSRELIIEFKHSVLGHEDRQLACKLEGELSGIANKCIQAYRRLIRDGQFTFSCDSFEVYKAVERTQMPVKTFIEEHLVITKQAGDFVPDFQLNSDLSSFINRYGVKHVLSSVNHVKELIVHHVNDAAVRKTQRTAMSWETGKPHAYHGLSGVRRKNP